MRNGIDWDSGWGFLLGVIGTWFGIIIVANLFIAFIASILAFIFWDASVYITAAYMFNPLTHMWMRIVGIILIPISWVLHTVRHGI